MARRLPLPRRFSAAVTEDAYARLSALSARYGLGSDYLGSVLLKRLDAIAGPERPDVVFRDFVAEYGAPQVRDARGNR